MKNSQIAEQDRFATGTITTSGAGSEAAAAVLRNTYRLLAMTLVFSALTAMGSAAFGLPHPGLLLTLAGYFGLLFLTSKLRNSGWGIAAVFALTGFMGFTLGPILNVYLAMANGSSVVATAMGGTAVVFLGMSIFARAAPVANLPKFGTFLFVGILTAFVLGLVAVFAQMPMLSLAVSGLFILLMSGLILYETQNIIGGGETNYVMATVTLFVAVFNLFTSFLHLLGFLGDDG